MSTTNYSSCLLPVTPPLKNLLTPVSLQGATGSDAGKRRPVCDCATPLDDVVRQPVSRQPPPTRHYGRRGWAWPVARDVTRWVMRRWNEHTHTCADWTITWELIWRTRPAGTMCRPHLRRLLLPDRRKVN